MSMIQKPREKSAPAPMGRPPLGKDRRDRQHTVRLSAEPSDRLREVLTEIREAEAAAGVPERSRTSESALIAAIVMKTVTSPVAIAALLADAREAARR